MKTIFVVALALFSTSCSLLYARFSYEFNQYAPQSRIHYQDGAEDLAQAVAMHWNNSVSMVENQQYASFKNIEDVKVYIFNDVKKYAAFSNTSGKGRGSSTTNEIYISPAIREREHTLAAILTHELSHVHLRQYLGTWSYATRLPGWFVEGVAVVVSGGAGAEDVGVDEAKSAMKNGHIIQPLVTGTWSGHENASDYDMKPHMFYRQSAMFVHYLRDYNEAGFQEFYLKLLNKQSFESAIQAVYGATAEQLWSQHLVAMDI